MSECDAGCKLCGALGCLRPTRLTDPEFLRELDSAVLACATTIVFPPNFLNHPEAAQFCAEVSRRGLKTLIRIRPSQLISMSELISTLEYRSASFEVIVSEAIPKVALNSRVSFKTILVPSREIDPAILLDAVPFAWRSNLEILSPLPSVFDHALSPDQLYLFLTSQPRPLRAYSEIARSIAGRIPGAKAELVVSRTGNDVRLSCILAISSGDSLEESLTRLANLAAQTLETRFFEVCVVCDRISDAVAEGLLEWAQQNTAMHVQILRLPKCWGDRSFRRAQAFNLAAVHARGSQYLFLSNQFPIEPDLLEKCSQRPDVYLALESRLSEKPARKALLMSARHFFNINGFSELEQSDFEFDLAGWKSARIGIVVSESLMGNVDKLGQPVETTAPKSSLARRKSAQGFFVSTLDPVVYNSLYDSMGTRPRLRRLFHMIATPTLAQVSVRLVRHLMSRADAVRLRRSMRVAMRST
jgi:hypothetical protein